MSTTLYQRLKATGLIEKKFEQLLPDGMQPQAACLVWAAASVAVLRSMGIKCLIQAGTASWPRIRPEQDDGVINTHFSYVWEPDSKTTLEKVVSGEMPEMHVWAGLPDHSEILDMTTKYLPEQAWQLCGMDWPGTIPPRYVWANVKRLPDGVMYQPDIDACKLAIIMLLHMADKNRRISL